MKKLLILSMLILPFLWIQSCANGEKKETEKAPESIEASMVRAMEWQEAHPIYALDPTDWTNGAYYTGVTRAHQATNNPIFLAALKTMVLSCR